MRLDADLYAALAALWSLGATVVLPEPAMGLKGLRHAARVTGATAYCSSGAYGVLRFLLPELWGCRICARLSEAPTSRSGRRRRKPTSP
jgi:hypothetical protein